jgi:hypothetical protein
VKIIDYGRSYFYVDEEINSTKIYETICKTPSCNKPSSSASSASPSSESSPSSSPSSPSSSSPSSSSSSESSSASSPLSSSTSSKSCGYYKGYAWFEDGDATFINSKKRNMSHDLRMLNIILDNEENLIYNHNDGTKEEITGQYIKKEEITGQYIKEEEITGQYIKEEEITGQIVNVTDAHLWFRDILLSKKFIKSNNKQFKYSSELGILEIWLNEDRPMIFTQTTQTTKQKKNNLYT